MIVSLSLMLTACLSAFAIDNPAIGPGQQVLDGFKKEFSSAQNVTWAKQDEFDKATFVIGGRRAIAYFSSDGNLEGCVRDIFFDQLPLTVMTAVDRRFNDAVVLDVREITNAEGTSYRIRLESGEKKYRVLISSSGNINEVQKIRK